MKSTRHPITAALRALGSLLPAGPGRRHTSNRVVSPRRADHARTYPTTGLTPSRLLALLRSADAGAPRGQFELFAEMLQKWPRLAAVENTRRLALTGLDWEILPATAASEPSARQAGAQHAADHCRRELERLDRFRDVLDHLGRAIGFGLSVAELVWENARLVDIVPVPHSRLISDSLEPWRLRVLTEEDPTLGVPLDEQPNKWIIHRPRAVPGAEFDGGLLRASALLYLAQNLSFKDWLVYSQIAGMPIRVAQFEPGLPESDKRQLLRMLESLGTDAVAAFAKNVELKFFDSARTGQRPYEPLQLYCNTEVTILWLGQHLTTDIKNSGSRAAAEVHDRVREDLLVDDMADESATLRRDLLTPLVRTRFGDDVPVPRFCRALVQAVDTKVLADTLAVAVRELGLRVPARWVHRALGIPEPQTGEAVLAEGRLG